MTNAVVRDVRGCREKDEGWLGWFRVARRCASRSLKRRIQHDGPVRLSDGALPFLRSSDRRYAAVAGELHVQPALCSELLAGGDKRRIIELAANRAGEPGAARPVKPLQARQRLDASEVQR